MLMRPCLQRSLTTRSVTSCLSKTATRVVVTRKFTQLASSVSSSPSSTPSSIFQTPQTRKIPYVRRYATEGAEEILKVPFLAESISKGEIGKIHKKPGDTVNRDESVMSIETDKTGADINAPYNAVVVETYVKEGDTVTVGQNLVKIKAVAAQAASAPSSPAPSASSASSSAPPASSAPSQQPAQAAAPKAQAAQPATPQPAAAAPKAAAPSSPAPKPQASAQRTETRERMTLIRVRTAERLKDSQNTAASLTTFNECDLTNVYELRATHGDAFLKKHGVKMGFMPIFIKASVAALQDQPIVNASIQERDIVYRSYNDVSVAVATERGLVVPVLRDCQTKSLADLEKELGALGARARLNQVSIEEMVGGTFTISNGGVYGSLMGTPIINPPQSAILGMHGIFKRPVVVNDKIEIRPMMYIALTYDHRLIDGREAVTFLRKIKDVVEDPRRLLLEL